MNSWTNPGPSPQAATVAPERGGLMSVMSHKRPNAGEPWDLFSPVSYKDENYADLREDDRKILIKLRKFFWRARVKDGQGIDVGTGPNLYPLLSMLPYCKRITLLDIAEPNIAWLRREIDNPDRSWDAFWRILSSGFRLSSRHYRKLGDFKSKLTTRASVSRGNLFALKTAKYDIGTMFFVAESVSSMAAEFERAIECFLRALKPGAPFAIALMRGSKGYAVADHEFPAVSVEPEQVKAQLKLWAKSYKVYEIPLIHPPIHDGYDGMMLAVGYAAEKPASVKHVRRTKVSPANRNSRTLVGAGK